MNSECTHHLTHTLICMLLQLKWRQQIIYIFTVVIIRPITTFILTPIVQGSTQIHFEGNGTNIRDIFIKAKGTQYINHTHSYTVRNFNLDYLNNYTATPNLSFSGNWNVTDTYKVTGPTTINNNIYSYSNNTFNKFDVPRVNQWIVCCRQNNS